MNADQARKKAELAKVKSKDAILALIDFNAQKGLDGMHIYAKLDDKIIKELKDLGYKVTNVNNALTITW